MKFWGSSFNFHWTKTDFYRWSSTSLEIKTTHLDLEFRDVPPVFHDKKVKDLWLTIDIGVFWCITPPSIFQKSANKTQDSFVGLRPGSRSQGRSGCFHGADQGGEIGMSETPGVVKGCFSKKHTYKSLQSKETVLYTWYDSLYTCINQLFVVKNKLDSWKHDETDGFFSIKPWVTHGEG